MDALTAQDFERYSRQIMLPEIGQEGQRRLLASKVLVVGVGGLGSPAALYLAAAGVGKIGLVDGDRVELSNLNRQIIHATSDVGASKVNSAAAKLKALSPDTIVETYPDQVAIETLMPLLIEYDFAVDATDSHESKLIVNRAACATRRPYSFAGVVRFGGQALTILPGRSACYECVFPSCDAEITDPAQAGVLGAVPGILGAIQAAEAVKFLLGQGDLLSDCLLTVEALSMTFRKLVVRRNPLCAACRSL
jgi:molybdopterin/thiamine biosynthesis adenylyltransferase